MNNTRLKASIDGNDGLNPNQIIQAHKAFASFEGAEYHARRAEHFKVKISQLANGADSTLLKKLENEYQWAVSYASQARCKADDALSWVRRAIKFPNDADFSIQAKYSKEAAEEAAALAETRWRNAVVIVA